MNFSCVLLGLGFDLQFLNYSDKNGNESDGFADIGTGWMVYD